MSVTYRGERFSGYNKPKATPNASKSHAVLAKKGDKVKLVRFGQKGKKGSPKGTARNRAFHARHNCSAKTDKFSAGYWACKHKWQIMATQKKVWNKKRPKSLGKSKKLTSSQKAKAKARARKAGRKYPNLVDNMWASKQQILKVPCPKCGQPLKVNVTINKLSCINKECLDYNKEEDV